MPRARLIRSERTASAVALGARFYREVSVGPGEGGAYSILLDGKPARTPGAAMLSVPNVELAEAIAEEWRAQGEKIRPQTMMLTKLANTAIDRVAPNRAAVVEQVLVFARSDLICYRAPGPDELAGRQAQIWDPLIAWAREHLSAPLLCTAGVGHVPQKPSPRMATSALPGCMPQLPSQAQRSSLWRFRRGGCPSRRPSRLPSWMRFTNAGSGARTPKRSDSLARKK